MKPRSRIVVISSVASPHVVPWVQRLRDYFGADGVLYIALRPLAEWRRSMGWPECQSDWIVELSSPGDLKALLLVVQEQVSAVVYCERRVAEMRWWLQQGKLVFYMSERWFKPPLGLYRLLHPGFLWYLLAIAYLARNPTFYYLAIGRRAALDWARFGVCKHRRLLWGYAPEPEAATDCLLKRREILFVGRLVEFKRVDLLLSAFASIQCDIANWRLTIVGDGPCSHALRVKTTALGIANVTSFVGVRSMEEVWDAMRSCAVLVLPSDQGEGWGAVVNEAMDRRCAVVVSEGAGCASSLVRDGETGFLFRENQWTSLAAVLRRVCVDDELRSRVARDGQEFLRRTWAPDELARRFSQFVGDISNDRSRPHFADGPLSTI